MRACWHGYSDSFEKWKRLPIVDRYLARVALDGLIKRSNDNKSGRPKDER
jgi:hypothetical protein